MGVLCRAKAVDLAFIFTLAVVTLKTITSTVPTAWTPSTRDISLLQKKIKVSKFMSSAAVHRVEKPEAKVTSEHLPLPPFVQNVLPNKTVQTKEEICREQEKLRLLQEVQSKLVFAHGQHLETANVPHVNLTEDQVFLRECRQRIMVEDQLDGLFAEGDRAKKLQEDKKAEAKERAARQAEKATIPAGWTGVVKRLASRSFNTSNHSSAGTKHEPIQRLPENPLSTTGSVSTTRSVVNATTSSTPGTTVARTGSVTSAGSALTATLGGILTTLSVTTMFHSMTTSTTATSAAGTPSITAVASTRTTTRPPSTITRQRSLTTGQPLITTGTSTTADETTLPPPLLTTWKMSPVASYSKFSNNGININIIVPSPLHNGHPHDGPQPDEPNAIDVTAETRFAKTTRRTITRPSTSTTASASISTSASTATSTTASTENHIIESFPVPRRLVVHMLPVPTPIPQGPMAIRK